MDADKLIGALTGVTKKWTKQKKKEERAVSARAYRSTAMCRTSRVTIRDAAYITLKDAYLKASDNGRLPAMARQVMYAARGPIQEMTGEKLESNYFTQRLLPDYLDDHAGETEDWDVVFDARGHFAEPHTDIIVPLGTLDVRGYLAAVRDHQVPWPVPEPFTEGDQRFPTVGAKNRFGAVLFVEKEGFLPLFSRVQLAQRYDLAIMSTKGMSVTASRRLVDRVCASAGGVPLLVLRDFDKAGFSIAASFMRGGRRYTFRNCPRVIDLGLRLEDVEPNGLESEDVYYKSNPSYNLRDNGATDEEIDFLYEGWCHGQGSGRRVELNAFTSAALVAWIESKLEEHGVEKVVPGGEALSLAYRRQWERQTLAARTKVIAEAAHAEAKALAIPDDLSSRVRDILDDDPKLSWDAAVAKVFEEDGSE
jgi:hypothetical protein